MTIQNLKPHLLRTKKLVLSGLTPDQISKKLGVSKRTVFNYLNQLVYLGELVIIGPENSTPRVYEDARRPEYPYNYNPTDSQTDNDPDTAPTDFKRVVPSTADSENFSPHDKMVRFHCTGAWVALIDVMGDHGGVIRDKDGYTIGEWSQVHNSNGSKRQYGQIRLYPNEQLHFTLYLAKAGPKLTVTPNPRYVYYRGSDITGPRALAEQVYKLMDVLTSLYGWRFVGIDNKSIEHYAIDNADLAYILKLADNKKDPDNARVHVDTSNGTPEIEFYNDHPGAYDDMVNIYDLPKWIDNVNASLLAIRGTLTLVTDNIGQLSNISAQIIKQQADSLNQTYTAPPSDNRGYQ